MHPWPPSCYRRAVAFVTDPSGRLLVFDHVGDPSSGTQVAAGGILADESPEEAVLRELAEESGVTDAVLVRKLGEAWNVSKPGNVPPGLEEQVHHTFHLELGHPPAEVWEWDECDGGTVAKARYRFRWVTLDEAAAQLWDHQAMWLPALAASMAAIQGAAATMENGL